MNENEKPVSIESVMAALEYQKEHPVVQKSKPARRMESNIDKVNRQVHRILNVRY